MTCKAIREGDEMACSCGLRWGIDDDDRPRCPADGGVKLDMTVGSHNTLAADEKIVSAKQDVAKDALKELHHIVEDSES